MSGFLVRRLEVTGEGKAPAVIEFVDGLNVVAGASDTGKSYLRSLIDYALGASRSPRQIEAARGYTNVALRIEARDTGSLFEIGRHFSENRVRFVDLGPDGERISTADLPARHQSTPTADTLSRRLLTLSGLSSEILIRTNAAGATRGLSFRDIAYLCIVDETRIIAERPPYRTDNPTEHTSRSEVLRLLSTGRPDIRQPARTVEVVTDTTGAHAAALDAIIRELEGRVTAAEEGRPSLTERLAALDTLWNRAVQQYETTAAEMAERHRQLGDTLAALAESESSLEAAEGLISRFGLLEAHYRSDLSRLAAIDEASTLLELLPMGDCPICGAAPEHHEPARVLQHYSTDDVQRAAEAERAKTQRLMDDLRPVVARLSDERDSAFASIGDLRRMAASLQSDIDHDLLPLSRASREQLDEARGERDEAIQLQTLRIELDGYHARRDQVREAAETEPPAATPVPVPMATDLDELLADVQALFTAWNLPGAHQVAFSEATHDLIIDGEARASHGKGIRALTCAGFILGMLRTTHRRALPHPTFVVLDSPLVAYREPDAATNEYGQLLEAGVKDAFYRSLADGVAGGQVIVFENEEPDQSLVGRIQYQHFSKSTQGRYGFMPLQE